MGSAESEYIILILIQPTSINGIPVPGIATPLRALSAKWDHEKGMPKFPTRPNQDRDCAKDNPYNYSVRQSSGHKLLLLSAK
ncbi:hypothetical protein D3C73_1208350 [compost metagenome]